MEIIGNVSDFCSELFLKMPREKKRLMAFYAVQNIEDCPKSWIIKHADGKIQPNNYYISIMLKDQNLKNKLVFLEAYNKVMNKKYKIKASVIPQTRKKKETK